MILILVGHNLNRGHGYRMLLYQLIFGNVLDRGTLQMYKLGQDSNGLVPEEYGGSCNPYSIHSKMGQTLRENPRADDNAVVIINIYSNFIWYSDGEEYLKYMYNTAN
eukprot:359391_1